MTFDSYKLEITKGDGKYIISYYCYLRDNSLIEFEGCFEEVVSKMYEWFNHNSRELTEEYLKSRK